MEIYARQTVHLPFNLGLRAYAVEDGLTEAFPTTGNDLHASATNALDYSRETVLRLFGEHKLNHEDYMFFIGIVWDDKNRGAVDLFGFGKTEEWPGNSDIKNWVYSDGIHKPDYPLSCENGIIILREEILARRKCRSLDEFFEVKVELGDLQPKHEL
jgi:hypothetical protein